MSINERKERPRAGIRFTTKGNEFGFISYDLEEYKPESGLLVINESSNGSCLVLNRKLIPSNVNFVQGLHLIIKVGALDPVTVVVRWVKFMDEEVIKFGVENTEKRHVIKFK